MMNRLKVLISAHELSPIQGSECAEGWNLVTRIAQYHDVTVLYARGSQFSPDAYEKAVAEYFKAHENKYNIKFIPIPQPRITLRLASLNKWLSGKSSSIGIPFLYFIGYRFWQKCAFRYAKALVTANNDSSKQEPYAIVHHLTQISFREPGYLFKLEVPFVWGPTGGNSAIPAAFYRQIGCRAAMYEAFRSVANKYAMRSGSRVIKAIKNSSLIYAFSNEDRSLFLRKGGNRVELMLDAGCEKGDRKPETGDRKQEGRPETGDRRRVLWVGQLIHRKALDILIKAVAGDDELMQTVEITVVGDGPLKSDYKKLINHLQPELHISFTGWLSRDQVFEKMQNSDVLVHTSYREATSNVIPEALSCGLPVICHDISGMSIAITDTCGIKVPLRSYHESISGFRAALKEIRCNSSDVLHRAAELSWDNMAKQIADDYARIAD